MSIRGVWLIAFGVGVLGASTVGCSSSDDELPPLTAGASGGGAGGKGGGAGGTAGDSSGADGGSPEEEGGAPAAGGAG